MEFTMFENHWYDSTFTPRDEATVEAADEASHDEQGSGSSPWSLVAVPAAVVALGVGAMAARRYRTRRAELAAERREIAVEAAGYANAINE
jgi:hypothetical protein